MVKYQSKKMLWERRRAEEGYRKLYIWLGPDIRETVEKMAHDEMLPVSAMVEEILKKVILEGKE